jgi:hypothetical protein
MATALYVGVTLETISAAGALGRERREQTLGILFLTPLRGGDIIAGKLISVMLPSLYGLMATLPIMSFSFFTGGVAATDFIRMMVALPNALFFSSTLGLLVSACERREVRAIGLAVFAAHFMAIGLPALGWFGKSAAGIVSALYLVPTPAGAFAASLGTGFGVPSAGIFWSSLVTSQLMAWGFIIAASWLLPKSIQDRKLAAVSAEKSGGKIEEKASLPSPLPERRELHRIFEIKTDRSVKWFLASLLWIGPLLVTAQVLWHPSDSFTIGTFIGVAVLLHLILKFMVVLNASRTLLNQRQTGELELMLTTPLNEADVLRGYLLALKRQMFWPAAAAIAMDLIFLVGGTWKLGGWEAVTFAGALMLEMIWMLLNVYSLAWVGLRSGMTASSLSKAILRTIFYVIIPPWIGLVFSLALIALLTSGRGIKDEIAFMNAIWFFVLVLLWNLGCIGWVNDNLKENFRLLAAHQEVPNHARAKPRFAAWRRLRFAVFKKA